MDKHDIAYMIMGFIVGASFACIVVEYSYREQLEQINEQFREEIESMKEDLPNITIKPCECSQAVYECECDYECQDNTPSFMRIAEGIAAHEYIEDVYDCTEFSDDLAYALRKEGWEVKRMSGYYYGNNGTSCDPEEESKYDCLHAWVVVEVPIEATGGWIIEPDIYDKYYSLKR